MLTLIRKVCVSVCVCIQKQTSSRLTDQPNHLDYRTALIQKVDVCKPLASGFLDDLRGADGAEYTVFAPTNAAITDECKALVRR